MTSSPRRVAQRLCRLYAVGQASCLSRTRQGASELSEHPSLSGSTRRCGSTQSFGTGWKHCPTGALSTFKLSSTKSFRLCRSILKTFAAVILAYGLTTFAAPSPSVTSRRPPDESQLRFWLQNMVWHHRFTTDEIRSATGLDASEITGALQRFNITPATRPARAADAPLLTLPYPGGRHPRIGFLDGAIDPQRETKFSVFTPWDETSYVVVDLPEALWSNLGLTYLAHTHIPTVFDKQGIQLPRMEWNRPGDGSLDLTRTLPNGIAYTARVIPGRDAVRLELWLTNGTPSQLSDLRVQMCVMLKNATGFNALTNANKIFTKPFAAVHNDSATRWILSAWTPSDRPWGNPPVPCLHSDPKLPDCPPGAVRRARGWLSFYEGTNVQAEIARIQKLDWLAATNAP